MSFKEIEVGDLDINPFTKIQQEWALLTAGTQDGGYNTMTVSWGGFGCFWRKDAISVYVRKSRYTHKFMTESDTFTVSFYPQNRHEALEICGKLSGKDCDKVKEAGLTPAFFDGAVAFEEASLVFVCKKLYHADMAEENVDSREAFEGCYRNGDLHSIYFGEVVQVHTKQ